MEQTISDQPSCLFKKSLKTSVTEKQLRNFLECSNLLHLNMIICLFELDFTNVFGVKLVFFQFLINFYGEFLLKNLRCMPIKHLARHFLVHIICSIYIIYIRILEWNGIFQWKVFSKKGRVMKKMKMILPNLLSKIAADWKF